MNKPSRTTFRARLDLMIQQLREDIISGKYLPGSYLPSEDDLALSFQLSKKSVRKGLESLVEQKLIVKKAKVGNMILAPQPNKSKITIRFFYYSGMEQEFKILELIEDFERKYPHIQVKSYMMYYDNYLDQATEFMNDGMLDVVLLNYYNFNSLKEKSHLHLLLEQKQDSEIYSFLNKAFVVNDIQYVKPFSFSPVVMCYNKEHFKELNLKEPDSSWTWEDFIRAAKELSIYDERNKRFGFFFYLLSENRWPLLLLQNGFKLSKDEKNQYSLSHDESFIKSIQMLKELFSGEDTTSSSIFDRSDDTERLFMDGKTSMIITTYFRLNCLKNVSFEYDLSPVPYIASPKTLLLNIGLGINRLSNQKEAAQLFVDYLTSKETQGMIRKHTLSIPSVKEVAEYTNIDDPSRFQLFKEIIPSFCYYTDMNLGQYLKMMTQHLKLYWSGLESASSVITKIEHEINKAVKANG